MFLRPCYSHRPFRKDAAYLLCVHCKFHGIAADNVSSGVYSSAGRRFRFSTPKWLQGGGRIQPQIIKQNFHLSSKCVASERKNLGENEYDLIVIGGGSGGLACAKEAADLGRKVAVLDYVEPSIHGSKWGLGGTCVNVGCIPKKLMHLAAIAGNAVEEAKAYGWKVHKDEESPHDWHVLRDAVQGYVKSQNWGHRLQLKDRIVQYYNAYGSFLDPNTICAKSKKKEEKLRGSHIVIATGLRPKYPTIPGSELGLSSDDIFSLKRLPNKTLVVGASYVALECAGFLNGLGFPVTTMIRSIPLRGFDKQMAYLITDHMETEGVKFLWKSIPKSVEKTSDGNKFRVTWENTETSELAAEEFDTVLWAIGREPKLKGMSLENAGVQTDPKSSFIPVNHLDATNVPNIFALGDVQLDRPELTPVAIKAGRMLAHRLYGRSNAPMDYHNVATTVFTPLEYGCVGMAEEDAVKKFGQDKIEVYQAHYIPMEFALPNRNFDQCYIKAIVLKESPQRVLGIHFLGPNAGEVTQGFAMALRCGLTWKQFEGTVGIHPTCAEQVVKLRITKSSGKDPRVTGC